MKRNYRFPFAANLAAAASVGLLALTAAPAFAVRPDNGAVNATKPVATVPGATFAYHSPAFTRFITDSYREAASQNQHPQEFYAWMDGAYRKSGVRYAGKEKFTALAPLLASLKKDYTHSNNPAQKTKMEMQTGAFLFRVLKKGIPKFSLDRGFEFAQAVQRGERQCYLQSVLVSGMMQSAGMKAGVVMVSKSEIGQDTNNGHCVALVKLSDGRDIVVDVSHKVPFATQQGLMVADAQTGQYRYVAPRYDAQRAITGYAAVGNNASVANAQIKPLDYDYLVSQFDYYRGERATGGFVSAQKTPAGLANSARYLEKAVRECPRNPLAVYVLGRVYLRLNQPEKARQHILAAYQIYNRAGWVPQGERDALALVQNAPQMVSMNR